MNRFGEILSLALVAIAAAGAAAAADGTATPPVRGVTQVKVMPATAFVQDAAEPISHVIYLNRCKGGCMITSSDTNSAAGQQSAIPEQPRGTMVKISEFAFDDTMWNDVVTCVKEIYSPYNVQIVTDDPGKDVIHHEAIVAGTPDELQIPPPAPGAIVLGKAAVNDDHSAKNNDISWCFANAFTLYPTRELQVQEMCATIGQETAHSWGLDHQFNCLDPMTYLEPCGGQRFFRNTYDRCGTYNAGDCNCDGGCKNAGPTQNSHLAILGVFGAGQSLIGPPTASMSMPKNGDTVTSGFQVGVAAASKRGIFKLKLFLNGYLWATTEIKTGGGTKTSPVYAPTFYVDAPSNVPDGVIDIDAQACDDLDQCTSAKATVTKGAPCSTATSCLTGQQCEAGKCFWPPATGELGDSCGYPQACKSGECISVDSSMMCSRKCFVGVQGQCPDAFSCVLAGQQGYCVPASGGGGGGCCSAGDEGAGATAARVGLAGFVMAIVFGRRRRRK